SRTCGTRFRKPLLYPSELQAHAAQGMHLDCSRPSEAPVDSAAGAAACAAEGNGMVPAIDREPCPAEAIAMPGGAGLRGGVVTACDAVGHGGLSPLPRGL